MKSLPIIPALFLSGFVAFTFALDHDEGSSVLDNVNIDVVGDQVVITDRDNEENFITISAEYELAIHDEPVKTSKKQQKILEEYYSLALDIDRLGKIIAEKGAELGSMAEGIALYALLKLAESFTGSDYIEGDEEFQHELEIDSLGDDINLVAEEFRELLENLEALHERMTSKISQLRALDWI